MAGHKSGVIFKMAKRCSGHGGNRKCTWGRSKGKSKRSVNTENIEKSKSEHKEEDLAITAL
jgi:hypothetical protein